MPVVLVKRVRAPSELSEKSGPRGKACPRGRMAATESWPPPSSAAAPWPRSSWPASTSRGRGRAGSPPRSLLAFVEDVGGLQLDSINVVERGHHLTLWSRFGPYDRAAVERIAYRRRLLFEYWAHAACLVPASHFPAWRRAMLDYSVRNRAWGAWLKKNRRVLRAVEDAIADGGPLGSADFEHRRAPGLGRGLVELEARRARPRLPVDERAHARPLPLALPQALRPRRAGDARGRRPGAPDPRGFPPLAPAAVAARDGRGQRDRPADVPHLPARRGRREARRPCARPSRRARSWRSRSRASAAAGSPSPRTCPPSPPPAASGAPPRAPPCSRPSTRSSGTATARAACSATTTRSRSTRPGHKRVHGYYSLPIFHDGQLVGRLDPKTHRAEKRLEVRRPSTSSPGSRRGTRPPAASWGRVDRDAALAGVAEALRSLADVRRRRGGDPGPRDAGGARPGPQARGEGLTAS